VLLDRPGLPRPMSNRTSYVIAPNGNIAFVHSEMSPAEHVRSTLAAVQKLKAS
jgi:thioredoxin-dependent peroxiredoxin